MRDIIRTARAAVTATPERLAWAILSLITPPARIKAGQTWRRRSDGLLMTVTHVETFGKHNVEVAWTGFEDPTRSGYIGASTFSWRNTYDLVTADGA